MLTLPTGNEKWLPAAEVRGEGIFFELDLDAVINWESSDAVSEREKMLQQAFAADGGNGDFPGIRFYLLHSLSHLLLTSRGQERNIEAGALIHDPTFAAQLERQWLGLIKAGLVVRWNGV